MRRSSRHAEMWSLAGAATIVRGAVVLIAALAAIGLLALLGYGLGMS